MKKIIVFFAMIASIGLVCAAPPCHTEADLKGAALAERFAAQNAANGYKATEAERAKAASYWQNEADSTTDKERKHRYQLKAAYAMGNYHLPKCDDGGSNESQTSNNSNTKVDDEKNDWSKGKKKGEKCTPKLPCGPALDCVSGICTPNW